MEAEIVEEPTPSRALVLGPRPTGLLRPVAAPAEIMAVQEETRALIEQALKPDRDYGVIPGTKKPTLLKPGAERINAAFACVARYKITEREIDHDRVVTYIDKYGEEKLSLGLYRYVLLCQLVHRDSGTVIGEGVGSCSTMEAKYISRPRDLENTALKMAKKRAYVDATLTTFGLSDQFTQDVEDMDREEAKPFALTDILTFGKNKGKTWEWLVQNDRGYVEWAIEKMDKLSAEARVALADALAAGNGKAAAGDCIKLQDLVNRAANLGVVTMDQAHQIDQVIGEANATRVAEGIQWLTGKIDAAKVGGTPKREPAQEAGLGV